MYIIVLKYSGHKNQYILLLCTVLFEMLAVDIDTIFLL